jgi:peroxiredoxin
VLGFFRRRWCPFCVGQMEAMDQVLPQILAAGASLVAISPQTVKQSFLMLDQHKLRFRADFDLLAKTPFHALAWIEEQGSLASLRMTGREVGSANDR